jgi:outer membrane protein assembly factor BamB
MIAIRLGGTGDVTDSAVKWKYHRSVPQLPSPLVYQGVLYMVNEGGIVTTLNPETGEVLKQGRLTGALGAYFASPIAGDGHIYFTSEPGAISVLPPGGDLTAISVSLAKNASPRPRSPTAGSTSEAGPVSLRLDASVPVVPVVPVVPAVPVVPHRY